MNLEIHQCKNCWKLDHTTFLCRIHGPHQTEHYYYFIWCCKANPKTNLPTLEMKQNNLCSYTFKCLNFQGEYQADSNQYPFWRHHFNKEWHCKKYQELYDNRKQSICSVVNGIQAWFWRTSKFYCKTFARMISLLIQFSKHKFHSILFLFKNLHGLSFMHYLSWRIVKGKSW